MRLVLLRKNTKVFEVPQRRRILPRVILFHGLLTTKKNGVSGTVQSSVADHARMRSGLVTLRSDLSVSMRFASRESESSVFLHVRSDRKLFNLARLHAKIKQRRVLIRELLLLTMLLSPLTLGRLYSGSSHALRKRATS
ncbi:hypothetical protein RRG08_067010 [Elysia crispata]|uniref:Uncharacterized protein n=1 Tax=Elysia crispata TaxID=231223 RepID=A0AAE0Z964_9GAST|nr:hypothetical protein RRG08_067010 [Elysia crispata]